MLPVQPGGDPLDPCNGHSKAAFPAPAPLKVRKSSARADHLFSSSYTPSVSLKIPAVKCNSSVAFEVDNIVQLTAPYSITKGSGDISHVSLNLSTATLSAANLRERAAML